MSNDSNRSRWDKVEEGIRLAFIFSPMILIGFVIILVVNGAWVLEQLGLDDNIERFNHQMALQRNETNALAIDARSSNDCDVLSETINELLLNGGNAESWLPDKTDRALKLAEKRYELLC